MYAASILEQFQLWRAFAQSEFINRSLPGLAMNLELEPVLKNCLHHGALHHQYARVTVRLGVNFEPFRMDPIRAALDGNHFPGSQLAVCIPVVRDLNQAGVIGVGQNATADSQISRR